MTIVLSQNLRASVSQGAGAEMRGMVRRTGNVLSPVRTSFLRGLAGHLAIIVGVATLLTAEKASAILFETIDDKPHHLSIGSGFQGTLLNFTTDLIVSGYGPFRSNSSATFYTADEFRNGFAWTAKHNFTTWLAYDSDAVFSVATV